MGHEVTITVQLDPETYLEVEPGQSGRWFNLPSIHPVSRRKMEQADAINFATVRGYLGLGFKTMDGAVDSAKGRSNRTNDAEAENQGPVGRLASVGFTGASLDTTAKFNSYSFPYNPGGRAPDGFMYPLQDFLLLVESGVSMAAPEPSGYINGILGVLDKFGPVGNRHFHLIPDSVVSESEREKRHPSRTLIGEP